MSRLQPELHIGFSQALRCADFRALRANLPERTRESVTALRYGLVAVAAIQHELDLTPRENWWLVIQEVALWGRLVSDHLTPRIAQQTIEPVRACLPLLRHGGDIGQVLRMVTCEFESVHHSDLFRRGPWWNRMALSRDVREENARSVHYARSFLERRRFGCEEVQEIALLGE